MAIASELGTSRLLECPQQETHNRQLSEHSAASRQPSENESAGSREACEQELVRRRGLEAMVAQVVGCDGHSWLKYGQKQFKGSTATRCYYRCARIKSIPRCPAKKTVDISCSNRNEPLSPDAMQVTYRCTLHNHPLPPRPPLLPLRRPPTRHQEQLPEYSSLPVWDLPPLSPLPTLLHSSPPWLEELIPVNACSTDLNTVDSARPTVSLEQLRVALGCQTLEEVHSRRLDGEDSDDPTDEINSLLGATSPTHQGNQELSSLRCSAATNHAGHTGLLPEYLDGEVTEEEQTAHGVGRNGENFFLGFRCDGEEGSVHGPSEASLEALMGSVLPHAAAVGAAVSDDPGFQAHQDVPVPPVTATMRHTFVNGQKREQHSPSLCVGEADEVGLEQQQQQQDSLVPSMCKVPPSQLALLPTAPEQEVPGPLAAAVFAFLGGSSSTRVSDFAAADVRKEMQSWLEGAA
ncbi:unnamed protein product [Closterium sp. Naga37s-1]|nr:unnamed protein product [Closterium sp. Naga37s-1]